MKRAALKILWFNDIPLIIVGVIINALITMGVYYRDSLFIVPFRLWIAKYAGFLLGIGILWLLVRTLYIRLLSLYPGYANKKKRWLRMPLLYTVFGVLLLFATGYVRPLIDVEFPGYGNPHIGLEYLMGTMMFLVNIYLYESFHLFAELKNLRIKASEIQKERITSQLINLKNQVSPHFLFNSLSTLIHLIDVDTEKSKEFVHKLAYVYQGVLEAVEENLVSIQQELPYLESYIGLLKERFGDNLNFKLMLSEKVRKKQIIPLALQLAIENAVKHNIISKHRPLHVSITAKDNYLLIKNNLQRKMQGYHKHGLGLKNISNRYQLLTDQEVIVEQNKDFFCLKLPLLA